MGEPERWRPAAGSPESRGTPVRDERAKSARLVAQESTRAPSSRASRSKSRQSRSSEDSPSSDRVAVPAGGEASSPKAHKGLTPKLEIPEGEQRQLQQEVNDKLASFKVLSKQEQAETREMLAEFVVCMAVSGKGAKEIQGELQQFMGSEAENVVQWFGNHIQ